MPGVSGQKLAELHDVEALDQLAFRQGLFPLVRLSILRAEEVMGAVELLSIWQFP